MKRVLCCLAVSALLLACNADTGADEDEYDESVEEFSDEVSAPDEEAPWDDESALSDAAIDKGSDLHGKSEGMPDRVKIVERLSQCTNLNGMPVQLGSKKCGGAGGITVRRFFDSIQTHCFWSEVTTNVAIPQPISAWTVWSGGVWGYNSGTSIAIASTAWEFGGTIPSAKGQSPAGVCTVP